MGYDVVCQFCGVGFGVGRIRTAQEPRSAAWHAYGWDETSHGFVQAESEQRQDWCFQKSHPSSKKLRSGRRHGVAQQAEKSNGCQVFRRPWVPKRSAKGDDSSDIGSDEDFSEDETYEYASSNESENFEPLEYASDIDELDQDDSEVVEDDEMAREPQSTWSFSVNTVHRSRRMDIIDTNIEPLSAAWTPGDRSTPRDDEYQRHRHFEHIAGPDCQREDAYNGHNITALEMLYGQTAQFLCSKRKIRASNEKWLRSDDDLGFELESGYFLTGLARAPPSSDGDVALYPPRHGLEHVDADNEFYDEQRGPLPHAGLPFHPTCFELFRQMSRVAFTGRTGIDGLMQLRDHTCRYPSLWPANYNDDVLRSNHQIWRCLSGCEYLVANPIFVEALVPILAAAVTAGHQFDFNIQNSAFEARNPALAATAGGDPFLRLPVEVMRCVVDYLDSKEIASMRSASHAFQQLPISLWYRLVRDEMPYLYEAWSDDIMPYPWASRLVLECQKFAEVKKDMLDDAECRRKVIKEDMPEILERWIETEKTMSDADLELHLMSDDRRKLLELTPIKLDLRTTDWYQLYTDITVNWRLGRLKGLRNRARIWKNIDQITNGIKKMKAAEGEDVSMTG